MVETLYRRRAVGAKKAVKKALVFSAFFYQIRNSSSEPPASSTFLIGEGVRP